MGPLWESDSSTTLRAGEKVTMATEVSFSQPQPEGWQELIEGASPNCRDRESQENRRLDSLDLDVHL